MLNKVHATGVILAGSIFLSACQSGGIGAGAPPAEPSADAIRESELRAFCPPVSLREGTAYYTTYERGGEEDPNRIIYLASISETTRACKYEGGGSITVAIAGKVVPGPKGRSGNVTLPLRIAMLRGTEVIYSQLFQHPVSISDVSGATQFVLSVPDILVPGGISRGITVVVGFDEGPR